MITGWTRPGGRSPGNLAFFEIRGPDAVRFLNGQISNDIRGDLNRKVVPACVCTMKGKVEALVRVTAGFSEGALLIEVDARQAEAVFNRLDRYLIADDCELVALDSPPALTHLIGTAPAGGDVREHWRFGLQGYDIFGEVPPGQLPEIPDQILREQKILHGIPEYGFEITGEEFPAELGLDKWAVDFHKGCYLGQEVVSRIESAGKVPKRLRLYETAAAFVQGHSFTNEAGREIARVVRDSMERPGESGRYLTSILAKDGFGKPDFQEIGIQFPPKV